MTTVYLATSGEYSDYRVVHVFTRREDAESYAGADSVEERELREGPVEVRDWHRLLWNPGLPERDSDTIRNPNPYLSREPRDYDGRDGHAQHRWENPPQRTGPVLYAEGWDRDRVLKVYSEQRARFLADREGLT